MDKRAIDALHRRAQAIGFDLLRHIPTYGRRSHNDWKGYNGEGLEVQILTNNKIRFKWNNHAFIEFEGMSPSKVSRQVTHKPRKIGGDIVDAQSTTVLNKTSVDQSRTYEVEIGEETTYTKDVGVDVTVGFEQSIRIGNDDSFVQGTLSFSQEVSTSYVQQWGSAKSTSRTTETEVTIPAGKKVTITTERTVGRLEQDVEIWGDLEHKIRVHSANDFDWTYESVNDFKLMLQGLLSEDCAGHHLYKKHRGGHWDPRTAAQAEERVKPLDLHYKHTVKFESATSGNVVIEEEDIK